MSARSVLVNALVDDMLDSTVLRSGLMDGFCVVLFEVGVCFLFGEFGSPPIFGEDHDGSLFSPCENLGYVIGFCRPSGL